MAFLEHEELIKRLVLLDITPSQYMVLYFIHSRKTDTLEALLRNNRIFKDRQVDPYELRDLIDRGYLLDYNTRGQMRHDSLSVNGKASEIFEEEDSSVELFLNELLEVYPVTGDINGKVIPLKTIKDRFKLGQKYFTAITGNREKHEDIIIDVGRARNLKLINLGIEKFIESRAWEYIGDLIKAQQADTSQDLNDME
jgi:hypothetical protein